jgi:hypothetical protein
VSFTYDTCPTHLILLHLITIMSDEQKITLSYPFRIPQTSRYFPLRPTYFPQHTAITHTQYMLFLFGKKSSHPQRQQEKVLVYTCALDTKRDTKDSEVTGRYARNSRHTSNSWHAGTLHTSVHRTVFRGIQGYREGILSNGGLTHFTKPLLP